MKKLLSKILILTMGIVLSSVQANAFDLEKLISDGIKQINDGIESTSKDVSNRMSIQTPKQDYGSLPSTYSEWKDRAQTMLKTPEGAVKMYFDGVFAYMNPQTRTEGQKMLRYVLRENANWDKLPSMATFVSRMKDPNYNYIFRSFAKGTSPDNNYQMDVNSYELNFVNKQKETDYTSVYIKSSGSDTPRNAWVKQYSDGNWHVVNNANLYGNIKNPASPVDDFDPNFE